MGSHVVTEIDGSVPAGEIYLGRMFDGTPITYSLKEATNPNVGLCGTSGSGKTHTIKKLIKGYIEHGITTYILDVHGNLGDIEGIGEEYYNHIHFSYTRGNGSINPLRVYPNEGVFIAISNFMSTIGLFSPSIGARQKSMIKKILRSLYQDFGFDHNDSLTWQNDSPVLTDLYKKAKEWLAAAKVRLKEGDYDDIKKYIAKNINPEEQDSAKREAQMADLGRVVYDVFYGLEDDEIQLDVARLESIVDLVHDMIDCGLFGEDSLGVKPNGGINRFVLTDLSDKDRLVIVHLLLDRVFNYAIRSCKKQEPDIPYMMVVLDEGKIAKQVSMSDMSPLNRIATEARKFGLGAVLGVQSPSHLTDDVIENSSLFFILSTHPSKEQYASRRFSIPLEQIQNIAPKSDALVFQNNGKFVPVHLFRP